MIDGDDIAKMRTAGQAGTEITEKTDFQSGCGDRSQDGEQTPHAESPCFVVGIGASAGGLEPVEHIFTALPADCALSFIVVMHLPAEGPSFLVDFIKRYTSMEVAAAEDGMPIKPNMVYVIPPGCEISLSGNLLRLDVVPAQAAGRHPIDRLFTSLAEEKGEQAIAVILSGFGLDGSEGVKRISAKGGIVIVQDPASAVNAPMPKNAIATGAADMILPVEDIAVRIAGIARGYCRLSRSACVTTTIDEDLETIWSIVKSVTGHDFSSYKKSTSLRRIERRMSVNETGGVRKYITMLKENPREAHALCQEILIGVTGFFRDPDAFEILRRDVIPRIFAGRDPQDPVRIWHPCCSTGEEVYSVAMLIREYLEKEKMNAAVQIFATDIDEAAVSRARSGVYTDDIVTEVGCERLGKFFTITEGRRQVAKQLREMILFAHHSIIKDPPFSRLDLLVCRNFLIYLDSDMQKRLISLFHMVLKPGGFLFLGSSETVGRNSELFSPVDKKWKIFQRLGSGKSREVFFPHIASVRKLASSNLRRNPDNVTAPAPGALAERLLAERYSPPFVVINEKYDVLHVSSTARSYLEVPVGEPTTDLLKLAREELRPALRAAVYKSFTEQKQAMFRGVKIDSGTGDTTVDVLVEPLADDPSYGKMALVVMEKSSAPVECPLPAGREEFSGDEASREILIRQLEDQLRVTHEQLQVTTEQLEASNEGFMSANEELMSINEEFQATNEELQSTNEELETSKEELQALNEELITVNAELQGKVEELNQANSDMENLFANSEIAAIFLDPRLNIKRFSPAMAAIFNLIPADIGRPFRQLSGTVNWSDLSGDAHIVMDKLAPVEREVVSLGDGRCFIMRVLPYRSSAGMVDGIVVTLVDISERKRMEERTVHLASFPQINPNPVLETDLSGRVVFRNPATKGILESQGMDAENASVFLPADMDVILENWDGKQESTLYREVGIGERVFGLTVHLVPQFDVVRIYGFDITRRKQAEDALLRAKEEWERTFDSVPDLIAILDDEHRITRVNRAMAERLCVAPEECLGSLCFHTVHGTEQPPGFCPHAMTMKDGRQHVAEVCEDSLDGDFLVTTSPLLDESGEMCGTVHVARDISERKMAEKEILRHVGELERFNKASVGRELRMVELKKEVNELRARLGEPPSYTLAFEDE